MSCRQLALERAGVEVTQYFASEIEKNPITVTQTRFPNTIQLGSVVGVKASDLPKIDLLIGGSPCQGFSFAGKQLNFEDPRSVLFFEYVRLLNECKPKYFLLENVKMKKEYQDVISEYLGVQPIQINSSLVSAQNRVRLYWTNIPNVNQPEDLGIVLGDIIEDRVDEKFLAGFKLLEGYAGGSQLNPAYKSQANTIHPLDGKAATICAGTHGYSNGYVQERPCELVEFNTDSTCHRVGTATDFKGHDLLKRVYGLSGKAPTLTAASGGNQEPKVLCGAWRGRYIVDGVRQDHKMLVAGLTEQRLEIREDGKTNCLTTVQKDNNVVMLRVPEATKLGYTDIAPNEGVDLTFPASKTRRGRAMRSKSNCLMQLHLTMVCGMVLHTVS
jgi:hypothetical protein